MKVREIENDAEEGFRPFTLALTFEDASTARLMWHVFNRLNLWTAIKSNIGGTYGVYTATPPVAEDFAAYSHAVCSAIKKHVDI